MQVTETLNEGLRRGYSIRVPATELEAKVTEKLEEARKDFQMKGFRKGKAPLPLMKKMFGKSVLGEAMQETIDAAMREHFEASGERPALQPEVKMAREDWQEGQDVEVSMSYEALPAVPEVALGELTLERLVARIEDAAVEEALANLAATGEELRGPQEGVEGQGRRPGGDRLRRHHRRRAVRGRRGGGLSAGARLEELHPRLRGAAGRGQGRRRAGGQGDLPRELRRAERWRARRRSSPAPSPR